MWNKQIFNGNYIRFQTLKSLKKIEPNCYSVIHNELLQQFETRFKDFKMLDPQFQLFSTPFAANVESFDVGILVFHSYLQQERFPRLHSQAVNVIAMFGSTYLCEQFFSLMKFNKSSTRTKLSDEHLQATLILATSQKIVPNIDALVVAKRCQLSSQK